MKKIITVIIFLIISGCGFKVVNLSESPDFSVAELNTEGDKRINYIIKNNFLIGSNQNEEKQINVDINTNKDKSIKEKNIKNEITKYTISIKVDVVIRQINEKNSYKFTKVKSGAFNVATNNSETRNNEKNLISLLSKKLASEILQEIRLKLNDI